MTDDDGPLTPEQERWLDFQQERKAAKRKADNDELKAAIRAAASDPGFPGRSDGWKRVGLPPSQRAALTREEILEKRRCWQLDPSQTVHGYLLVSKTTLMRHRHKFGLVPWPEEYRDPIR